MNWMQCNLVMWILEKFTKKWAIWLLWNRRKSSHFSFKMIIWYFPLYVKILENQTTSFISRCPALLYETLFYSDNDLFCYVIFHLQQYQQSSFLVFSKLWKEEMGTCLNLLKLTASNYLALLPIMQIEIKFFNCNSIYFMLAFRILPHRLPKYTSCLIQNKSIYFPLLFSPLKRYFLMVKWII